MELITSTDFNVFAGYEKNLQINRTELVALVTDAYFQDQDNWSRILITYKSSDGKQLKSINVTGNDGNFTFSGQAKSEDWSVDKIVIYDYDKDFYIVRSDDIPSASSYNLNIVQAPENLSYDNNHTYEVGVGITPLTPTVTGRDITYSSDTLPAGLSINSETGVISGTPTEGLGGANYTITASNSYGNTTFELNITVNGNYWGSAINGDTTYTGTTNYTVPNKISSYDGDMVVRNYSSLTINSGVTISTDQPCRGLLVYVKGDCTINGTLSMTARGAYANPTVVGASDNHAVSASGIRFKRRKSGETDTLSDSNLLYGCGTAAVTAENNQSSIDGDGKIYTLVRTGASGGTGMSGNNGVAGSNGSTGQSGGGGGGGKGSVTYPGGGYGSAGTCFSGGTGGGGASYLGGSHATAYGGPGGAGGNVPNHLVATGGGAGNPGGAGKSQSPGIGSNGSTGTGGLLVLIVKGDLTIGATGVISANGRNGGGASNVQYAAGGGASGGGNILILHGGSYSNSGTVQANGGSGGVASGTQQSGQGGNGGNGSVQVDQIDL